MLYLFPLYSIYAQQNVFVKILTTTIYFRDPDISITLFAITHTKIYTLMRACEY